ncbi:hypothetical protein M3T53_05260 [Actinomyces sp. B33]|uniref:YczE/YyaS/YitT family protein n=1 Tax=Actinomyces sp. B33 TaxID=2942131 RepID=UPI002341FDB8|nr:hypothetical protein [Actinomyces sp. B33]MDC4233121.1 hypothetical protein [Actinomyces sp. B33]
MSRGLREEAVRLVLLLVGLTIAHLGVSFFLEADLGSDPFNVLVQGVFRVLDPVAGGGAITHGRVHMTLCVLIIVVLLVVDRGYVKAGTFVCMALGGPIIDLWRFLMGSWIPVEPSTAMRLAMVVVGCVLLAYGMTLVISSDAGTGPNDLVAVVLADRSGLPFSVVKIVTDCLFVLGGFLLSATVGLGTLVCMVLVGMVAGVFLPINRRFVASSVGRLGRRAASASGAPSA